MGEIFVSPIPIGAKKISAQKKELTRRKRNKKELTGDIYGNFGIITNKKYYNSDFGLAVVSGQEFQESTCGTPLYMAPEILRRHSYSLQCDIWR